MKVAARFGLGAAGKGPAHAGTSPTAHQCPVAQPRRARGEDRGPPPRLLDPARRDRPGRGLEPGTEPEVVPDPQQLAEQAAIARREASALVTRTRERYTAVQNLRAQGKGIKTIMGELGLAKETVRRFARATKVEDLLGTARAGRPSVLDEFKPYLHHRFNLGHTNGSLLFAEIRGQGYRGSLGTVLGYLRPFRARRRPRPRCRGPRPSVTSSA